MQKLDILQKWRAFMRGILLNQTYINKNSEKKLFTKRFFLPCMRDNTSFFFQNKNLVSKQEKFSRQGKYFFMEHYHVPQETFLS